MSSTTSFFNPSQAFNLSRAFSLSPALIRENLKRFWAIPAFGFAGYFFTGVFPMLMLDNNAYNDAWSGGGMYDYMRMILNFRHPGFLVFFCLFPLIASVILQRYMYTPGAAAVMHSLPFTRPKLFNSNFVSGLLLIWTPIVAAGILCLLLVALRLANFLAPGSGLPALSVSLVLYRFGLMLLLTLFIYAVCMLAGTVCGNTPMHLVVCGLLSGILPGTVLIGFAYCQEFLFGFSVNEDFLMFVAALSPVVYLPVIGGEPSAAVVLAYIAAAAVLYGAANILYARKPLEKAGDSLAFPFMEWVFCLFAALGGMTVGAFYFYYLNNQGTAGSYLYFYVGMLVGAVVAFALARIIVKKSRRILTRETGLQFGVFALAALLLFLGLRLDLYGYERRVPAVTGVESVALNIPYAGNLKIVQGNAADFYVFSDEANIEAITAFHRQVAANRAELKNGASWYRRTAFHSVQLSYELSGRDRPMSRNWPLPLDFCAGDAYLRSVVESEEFRRQNSLTNPKLGTMDRVILSSPLTDMSITLSSDEFPGIAAAINEDLRSLTYEQLFDLTNPIAVIDVSYKGDGSEGDTFAWRWFNLSVSQEFEHTLAWLAARGYYDRLAAWRDSVRSISLTRHEGILEYEGALAPVPDWTLGQPREIAVFRDPELIRAALELSETAILDNGDYYALYFAVPPPGAEDALGEEFYNEHVLYLNPGNPALDLLLAAAGK
jgi:ABC-2 type transport system permease protein